jgi:hypothetical protein
MSMCITIADIQMKPKRCIVITTAGRRLGCWADKIATLGLEAGGTYNVETVESQFGDATLTNIVSAKRVTQTAAAQQQPDTHTPTGAIAAGTAFRTPEQITTAEIICAYISNGRCPPEKLAETIGYVRRAWNSHWGEMHREAAE